MGSASAISLCSHPKVLSLSLSVILFYFNNEIPVGFSDSVAAPHEQAEAAISMPIPSFGECLAGLSYAGCVFTSYPSAKEEMLGSKSGFCG